MVLCLTQRPNFFWNQGHVAAINLDYLPAALAQYKQQLKYLIHSKMCCL